MAIIYDCNIVLEVLRRIVHVFPSVLHSYHLIKCCIDGVYFSTDFVSNRR